MMEQNCPRINYSVYADTIHIWSTTKHYHTDSLHDLKIRIFHKFFLKFDDAATHTHEFRFCCHTITALFNLFPSANKIRTTCLWLTNFMNSI